MKARGFLLISNLVVLLFILSAPAWAETLCSYPGPDLSPDLLRLTDFTVSGPAPLKAGDAVTVKFTLQNYGQYDLNLGKKGLFAAAKDPDGVDASFGFSYASGILKTGESLSVSGSTVLDKPGTWSLWPSYQLSLAAGEKSGPEGWHACTLKVSPAALPDLAVDKIGVGPDNRLYVTIKNGGTGTLPEGWQAVAEVYFDKVKKGSFDLKTPASVTGGGIAQPGGSAAYLLTWKVTAPVSVRVVADAAGDIAEADEQNNAGEEKVMPAVIKLPDLVALPKTLKIVSGPAVSQITQTAALVRWATDEASDSLVRYGARSGEYGLVVRDGKLVKEHSLRLTGLKPGTVYQLIVESKDAEGNRAQSRSLSFQTLPPADTAKPAVSLQLPDTLSGIASIAVSARDNVGVDRVVFFLDGKPVFTDFAAPFAWDLDTRELNDGAHTITVRAFDAAGNLTEAVRTGNVRNRFPVNESPVRVTIEKPVSGSEVYGVVEIKASVVQEKGGCIKQAVVKIDGSIVQRQDFLCTRAPDLWGRPRIAEKSAGARVSYRWDTRGLPAGRNYVIEVEATDVFGNGGHSGIMVTKVDEPRPGFEVNRRVTRRGNCFHVDVTVRNTGTGAEYDAGDVIIRDISRGFQAAAFERTPAYDWRRSEVAVEKFLPSLPAGGTVTFSYDVVPVLLDPEIDDYAVGARTEIKYVDTFGRRNTQDYASPYIPGPYTSYPYPLIPQEVGEIFHTVDYLIITDPERLFHYYAAEEVNRLLSAMATLAIHRNGALGYRRPGTDWFSAQQVKDSVGRWSNRLSLEAALSGYLLIVGETEIVPSFDVSGFNACFNGVGCIHTVRDSDYPYADVCADARPELKVGRIIGENVRELLEPINASIGVSLGRLRFDRSEALLVSGPEGTWENFVADTDAVGEILQRQGVRVAKVHTEYYSTEKDLLREALVIRGDYECTGEPGHLEGGTPCPKSHPPTNLADLRALITVADAEEVEADRRDVDGDYNTSFTTACNAGDARGRDVKSGARDKDIIFWNGHGGPGGWAWVLDDFMGGCGATNLFVDLPGNPLRLGAKA
ncbi:MAG: Ig-like domain-containing protein, partial [Bacillota bacterium]